MNKLYLTDNVLGCMEHLIDDPFQLIFMEPPFNTGTDFLKQSEIEENDIKYGKEISHLVECAKNLLSNSGCFCFSIISVQNKNYNYQMILEHFFKHIISFALKDSVHRSIPGRVPSHRIIYCCSTDKSVFENLMEQDNSQSYKEVDDNGRLYRLIPAFTKKRPQRDKPQYTWHYDSLDESDSWRYTKSIMDQEDKGTKKRSQRDNLQYTWHNISLDESYTWICTKPIMDQEYEKGNIIIQNGIAYKKKYLDESYVPIPNVWENNSDIFSISKENMYRIINLFSSESQRVLCPFDRDGKFAWCASQCNRQWTSITKVEFLLSDTSFYSQISDDEYEFLISEKTSRKTEYENVVKSKNEIDSLQAKVIRLQLAVRRIQEQVGLTDNTADNIDDAIEQIHGKIAELLSSESLSEYIPESQKLITPHWEKLEEESKRFLPTGEFLFKQLGQQEDADYAPVMIEYCRTLENEMFSKMFKGYIYSLIKHRTVVNKTFKDSFAEVESKTFADFVNKCTTRNANRPSEWKFEIGKMFHVLDHTLIDAPQCSIFLDFREYLSRVFKPNFNRGTFIKDLSRINDLRNDCAHRGFIRKSEISSGKQKIVKKLNIILENYI